MPLPFREVEAVGDPGERRGRPRLHMQFDPRLGTEHRQIRLRRDVSEPDAADLHRGSPVYDVLTCTSSAAYGRAAK
ncbi:hypothetical protein SGFS_094540 [Streptomyces graminofaciens]|uniref:Uncharacterized protein n=1 Tax=Streptomyces graminofaciens TaxID=68212 RepID=A0ABM7FN15_9ACTN|nr:hypothetical protein SGFS_094540 [Streptomyces graminofaciens]